MDVIKKRPVYMDYILLVAGSFIMGFAIKNIYDPINLVTGGVSGIAIIVKNLTGIPLWLTNTMLNIPLFLAALKMKGWNFIKRTLAATVCLSLSLYMIPSVSLIQDDMFLAALFGGIISGVGTGMVFVAQATTGGTDMMAAILQKFARHYSIAQILQVLDAAVVLAGASLFGIHSALYALIAIFVVSKISDGMIEGVKFSKAAYIISEENDAIAAEIMNRLERGVTALPGKGMYSGQDRQMLFCVVSKKEIIQIKEIISEIDPSAFVIVSDAREVIGEGFMEYRQ